MKLKAKKLIADLIAAPAAGGKLPTDAGVYTIVNRVNGRAYIGSAVNIRNRVHQHRCQLRNGKHSNKLLLSEWAEHGEGAFIFGVLVLCHEWDRVHIERELTKQILGPACYSWGIAGQRCRYMGHPAVPGYGAARTPVRQGEAWA